MEVGSLTEDLNSVSHRKQVGWRALLRRPDRLRMSMGLIRDDFGSGLGKLRRLSAPRVGWCGRQSAWSRAQKANYVYRAIKKVNKGTRNVFNFFVFSKKCRRCCFFLFVCLCGSRESAAKPSGERSPCHLACYTGRLPLQNLVVSHSSVSLVFAEKQPCFDSIIANGG